MLKRILLLSAIVLSLGVLAGQVHAQEALCAEVKIEILQELTMERQGFEALMRITNSLDSFSLENVSVSVNFADENGNPVVATSNTSASNAAFFIRIDDTRNFTGLQQRADGLVENGTIAPKQVGELRWLIIPTATAAGQLKDGKLYFVGAQLRYSYGGKEEVVDVAADTIVVKPQPALTLDYFLTQEVIGDDAFTTQVEPPVPYTLGVRLNNSGYGYAKAVKIESAQPTIVENDLGLAVDFKILSSYLGDQPAAPTLLINFGTINPHSIVAGRWMMETNLSGKFTAFTASFTHADELGGELTSLLQSTNAHFLVRDVLVNLPGRDTVRDFLAYNPQRDLFVYESESTGLDHALCISCAAVTTVTASLMGQGITSNVSHAPTAGFSYAKVADPFNGTKVLERVVRSDGAVLNSRNAWLSKERAANGIAFNYFINIFDHASAGSYTLHWGGNLVDEPQPPVIQYIVDRVTHEGGSIGFLVQASDPNETIPNLTVKTLPTGAGFVNQAPNTGVLQWNPAVGQAGIYTLTFVANDGALTAERSVTIRVNPAHDIDGDGMDDQWELDNFGNLDRDGTGDADGDGRNDLQEFEEGTDPNVTEMIPGTPQILSPIFDADTLNSATAPYYPLLSVTNGNHGIGIDDVAVTFEIYSDEGLTELVALATVSEGNNITSIQFTAEHLIDEARFTDNHLYYWRVRAADSMNPSVFSAWVKSRFFINSANEAPSIPLISNPAIEGVVADVSPELIVINAIDRDRDRLYYSFVVYEESNPAVALAEVNNLTPGNNGQTRWRIPKILAEDTRYLWQVVVTDEHGLSTASEWGSFLVSTTNHAPGNPQIISPLPMAVISDLEANNSYPLTLLNSIDPERKPVKYRFELDTLDTFNSPAKQSSGDVLAGQMQTVWSPQDLQDNTHYYWRAKANDGEVDSEWVTSRFTVSLSNQPPSVPVLQNPVGGITVPATEVFFEVNPAADPEGTIVKYHFELYADQAMSDLISSITSITPQWQQEAALINQATYFWRVKAEDEQGIFSGWSPLESFTIKLPVVNEKPTMSFLLPDADVTLDEGNVLIQWQDSDSDSDAKIRLFVINESEEEITIANNIDENPDGENDTYSLSAGILPPGVYRIGGEISDEQSSVKVLSCCNLIVPQPAGGTAPHSHWSFNENNGVTTASVNGLFNAELKVSTVSNNTAQQPTWINGRNQFAGAAISMDGNGGYIELEKEASQPLLTDASLSFWINHTEKGGAYPLTSPALLGSDAEDNNDHLQWGSLGPQGQLGIAIGDARLVGLTPINNKKWHHVVITRKQLPGSRIAAAKIYVNGYLDAVGYPHDPSYTGTLNNLLGFGVNNVVSANGEIELTSASHFLAALIDDVRIYPRALTEAEIVALYAEEGSNKTPVIGSFNTFTAQNIYQAEAAVIYKGRVARDHSGYSGLAYVDFNAEEDSYVEWVVERDAAGPVSLEFVYASGPAGDRPLRISVNDAPGTEVSFPSTGGWAIWAKSSTVVNLQQGTNRIRAISTSRLGGANVDYLEVKQTISP